LLPPLVLPADLRPATVAPDAPAPGSRLGQHYSRCYGCGEAAPSGLRMQFIVGEGVSVVSQFVVTDQHEGAAGLAHGGLLAAALDETQATLLWVLRMPAVTARLEADYLAPVPVGSTVRIEATCLGLSDRKIFTAAQGHLIKPNDGNSGNSGVGEHRLDTAEPARGLLAMQAAALFIAVPVEHFTAYGRPDLVAASMNRGAETGRQPDRDARRIEVNP
jgi:acyl-coenzyme A thioesterase PaaI-like protein